MNLYVDLHIFLRIFPDYKTAEKNLIYFVLFISIGEMNSIQIFYEQHKHLWSGGILLHIELNPHVEV
jgi:hypothetical protein